MQTIGERLEEARKRKGISVREAAELTKIRSDYLQKFESNTFEIGLPPLYVRGFIRTYARFLELDPERITSDVDALWLQGRHELGPTWALQWSAGALRQGDLYERRWVQLGLWRGW